jgi:hypothetical protein
VTMDALTKLTKTHDFHKEGFAHVTRADAQAVVAQATRDMHELNKLRALSTQVTMDVLSQLARVATGTGAVQVSSQWMSDEEMLEMIE